MQATVFSTTETNKAHPENLFIIYSPGLTVPGHLEEDCPIDQFQYIKIHTQVLGLGNKTKEIILRLSKSRSQV